MNEPIKVLLVEDNSMTIAAFTGMLQSGSSGLITVKSADSLESALGCLASDVFDVVMLDLMLGDAAELYGLTQIRSRYPDLPIVVVTGLGREWDGPAMRAGADEFIDKSDVNMKLLNRTLRHAVIRRQGQARRQSIEESLARTQECINQAEAISTCLERLLKGQENMQQDVTLIRDTIRQRESQQSQRGEDAA